MVTLLGVVKLQGVVTLLGDERLAAICAKCGVRLIPRAAVRANLFIIHNALVYVSRLKD